MYPGIKIIQAIDVYDEPHLRLSGSAENKSIVMVSSIGHFILILDVIMQDIVGDAFRIEPYFTMLPQLCFHVRNGSTYIKYNMNIACICPHTLY